MLPVPTDMKQVRPRHFAIPGTIRISPVRTVVFAMALIAAFDLKFRTSRGRFGSPL